MNEEANRLATFAGWPTSVPVDVGRIARGGFYATGRNLEAECNWCHQRIENWHYGEQVMSRHRELDPLCPFITNPNTSGNVPIMNSSTECAAVLPQTTPESQLQSKVTPQHPDYMSEAYRLSTFTNWPITCVTPHSLAKAGFYYYNQSDHVRCAWCQGVIAKWELGDNPFEEHVKFFPSCPRAMLGPNVEITNCELNAIGIQTMQPTKTDKFSNRDMRIRSYVNWPKGDIQSPEDLSTAGFYYLNEDDHVRCFYCNGGLRSWLADDDPWEEHAKWFPRCSFLQLVKGQQYVQHVQNRMRPTLDEVMTGELPTQAMQMGFRECEVRSVTKRQITNTGKPFANIDDLVLAVLQLQGAQPAEEKEIEPNTSNAESRTSDARLDMPQSNGNSSDIQTANSGTNTAATEPTANVTTGTQSAEASASESSLETLEDENRQLKDARLCKVCMVDEVGIVFLPCGHLVSCVQCAPSVTSCPLCRTPIKAFVRTYLS